LATEMMEDMGAGVGVGREAPEPAPWRAESSGALK
jgi:hypothetical protein